VVDNLNVGLRDNANADTHGAVDAILIGSRTMKTQAKAIVVAALNQGTRPIHTRNLQRALAQAERGKIQLTIGSGGLRLPGWICTDIGWQADMYLDIVKPWPVEPGSIAFIWADNVIEHLTLPMGRAMLENAFLALAPGGVIRLATPDVEAVAHQYLDRGELATQGLERNRELGRDYKYPVQLLRVMVDFGHSVGQSYDYEALSGEMTEVGFEVQRQDAGISDYAPLRGLDRRLHPAEVATSLIVEGTKPSYGDGP
jgi:predicted SAM-dependent methyltransferase